MTNWRTSLCGQTSSLPEPFAEAVAAALRAWGEGRKMERLWALDASLWTNGDEGRWLGWLDEPSRQKENLPSLRALSAEIGSSGFSHALLLGMGGSSLCPEVLRETFGRCGGAPEFHVLDSTDPGQVRTLEDRLDPARTLYIVSSKSGSTLEPNLFKDYFFDRACQALGRAGAASRFIAITDPGSSLEKNAQVDAFRHVFHGRPDIGGRFSALSAFGLVPAAVMGLDVEALLGRALKMVHCCSPGVPAAENPGLVLGLLLGTAALQGLNKITFFVSPGLRDLGAWLEQLLAESTGKAGQALIPVDREAPGRPDAYGSDRVFVYLRLGNAPEPSQDEAADAIGQAGHPLITITVRDPYDLGAEFFRWEVATAVAGAVMGLNPFDQPDVEAAKVETRKLTTEVETTGRLPVENPFFEERGLRLFADAKNAAVLHKGAAGSPSLAAFLGAHLDRIVPGDYFGLLAFLEMNPLHEGLLQTIRHAVRDRKRVATCLGFGPRFLHSTGQAYKGGPNTGVFLQVTCDHAEDLPLPGRRYTFGTVEEAQARGDFRVLANRGRRLLRVHLGPDISAGLTAVRAALEDALS
jgi:transaldolase / glucose-6-phosphate isomerase